MASPDLQGDTHFTRFLDVDKLGLKFNGEEITSVTPDGWAAKNGIEVDDEISKVGGQEFKVLSHQERVNLLLNGKRPLEILFKRPCYKDVYFTCSLTERKIGMTMKGKYVKTVDENGWAVKNGVQVGDEIAELGGKGYAGLTDEERLKVFSGGRPLTIRFVRRNQKTMSALARENKGAAKDLRNQWNKATDGRAGIDPTTDGLTVEGLTKHSRVDGSSVVGGGKGLFCACCHGSPDRSAEFKVKAQE